jgi:hypothetical protein
MKHLFCLALPVTFLVTAAGCGSGSAGSTSHDAGHDSSRDASDEKDASSDAKTKPHGDASSEGGTGEEGGAGEGGSEDAGEGGVEAGDAASSGSSAWCAQTVMGVAYCYGQEGLVPAQVTTFDATCMTNMGTVVSSCSTTGLVGCCTYAAATTLVYCSYSGTASADQTSCTTMGGTWSTSP